MLQSSKKSQHRARIEFNKWALVVPILLIVFGVLLLVIFYSTNYVVALVGGLLAFVGFFVLFFLSAVLGYFLSVSTELSKRKRRRAAHE